MNGEVRVSSWWARIASSRKPAALLCTFIAFVFVAKFETSLMFSSIANLVPSALMVLLLFTHNSLVTTTVLLGMLFIKSAVDALPKRFWGYNRAIVEHQRGLAAVFTAVFIVRSWFQFGGFSFELFPILIALPVVAIESYGIYLATFFGLHGRVSVSDLLKVYITFLIGAIVETTLIASIPYLRQLCRV